MALILSASTFVVACNGAGSDGTTSDGKVVAPTITNPTITNPTITNPTITNPTVTDKPIVVTAGAAVSVNGHGQLLVNGIVTDVAIGLEENETVFSATNLGGNVVALTSSGEVFAVDKNGNLTQKPPIELPEGDNIIKEQQITANNTLEITTAQNNTFILDSQGTVIHTYKPTEVNREANVSLAKKDNHQSVTVDHNNEEETINVEHLEIGETLVSAINLDGRIVVVTSNSRVFVVGLKNPVDIKLNAHEKIESIKAIDGVLKLDEKDRLTKTNEVTAIIVTNKDRIISINKYGQIINEVTLPIIDESINLKGDSNAELISTTKQHHHNGTYSNGIGFLLAPWSDAKTDKPADDVQLNWNAPLIGATTITASVTDSLGNRSTLDVTAARIFSTCSGYDANKKPNTTRINKSAGCGTSDGPSVMLSIKNPKELRKGMYNGSFDLIAKAGSGYNNSYVKRIKVNIEYNVEE